MDITFVLYEQMTALDFVGPYEVLSKLPDVDIHLAALQAGPIPTDTGVACVATKPLEEIAATDIIVVPGTGQILKVLENKPLLDWLRSRGPAAQWVCSVCTGSLLLGAAGLLEGKRATSHWLALPLLADFGATPVSERYVFSGNRLTGAGVSAGIDMALALVCRLVNDDMARVIQLGIEYDPAPPLTGGSPATSDHRIIAQAEELLRRATGL